MKTVTVALGASLVLCLVWLAGSLGPRIPPRTGAVAIVGARIADGTGAPLHAGTVRIERDTIVSVSGFGPLEGDTVVAANGLVLAPGFIDPHNHSAEGLLSEDPLAVSQISQGITTALLGPDGSSPWPIADYLDRLRAQLVPFNVLLTVGHATVRRQVMGDDYKRPATPEEVSRMAGLVERGMREGAVGLSSGLEYEVGGYASTDEVIALAKAAGRHRGFYISHIRDEADRAFEAMRELVRIGEEAHLPVQNTHMKLGTVGVWGRADAAVALYDEARARGVEVTADVYPYDAWHSTITVLVPNKQYDDPQSVERALSDVGGPANVRITNCTAHPYYEGRNLEEIATAEGVSPVDVFIRIVRDGGASVIGKSMIDADIERLYRQPWAMVGSDGGIGMRHPRATGTFPRVLGRFVRERHWLSLEEAVRKMTSLPAARLKLADRGVVLRGMKADLVLFDPRTVADRSTFDDPGALSEGIEQVYVNGVLVWRHGAPTGARPGRILK